MIHYCYPCDCKIVPTLIFRWYRVPIQVFQSFWGRPNSLPGYFYCISNGNNRNAFNLPIQKKLAKKVRMQNSKTSFTTETAAAYDTEPSCRKAVSIQQYPIGAFGVRTGFVKTLVRVLC